MNKLKANYHTHTTCCDGSDAAEAVVQEALRKGFTHLGFSGHMDPGVSMDYAAYAQEICRLQAAYRDRGLLQVKLLVRPVRNTPSVRRISCRCRALPYGRRRPPSARIVRAPKTGI